MITNELTTYIQDELKKGTARDEIAKHLLSKGWKQEDIDQALKIQTGATTDAIPTPPPDPQSDQQYYVQAVPAEPVGKHPGKTEGIIAIIFAVISLLFLPPVFGGAGIVLAVMARKKGQKELGLVGIILSSIFMVIGMILGIAINVALKNHAAAKGMVGLLFLP